MIIIEILVAIYLIIGIVYGFYIWLFQGDVWYLLPINILTGPIFLVYNYMVVKKNYKNRKL